MVSIMKQKYFESDFANLQDLANQYGSWNKVCQLTKISPTTIYKAIKAGKLQPAEQIKSLTKVNWEVIQNDYDNGLSIREICLKYKLNNAIIKQAKLDKKFKTRNLSKSSIIREKLKPKKHSDKVRLYLSHIMKERHKNGTAHTLGHNRNKQKPSYPEKFIAKVIITEIKNQSFKRELKFHRFSLDFAWPELKRCIEVDGEQHDRFEDQKVRDQNKDNLLRQNGWCVLRLKWKEVYRHPKYYIGIIKCFIDGECSSVSESAGL